jgi:O-acetyl-ADP-ribose deacetylase (regulator of RNase III)
MSVIELIQSDITKMDVDAIVNAANSTLRGGGGVDGAIHRAAGPQLFDEYMLLKGCPTGEAKITKGYNLEARYVIHTVGPIWHGGSSDEKSLLASCYRKSLLLAVENKCTSIAFSNISTGVYGFPKELAADIAICEVRTFILTNKTMSNVFFSCFDSENFLIYKRLLEN